MKILGFKVSKMYAFILLGVVIIAVLSAIFGIFEIVPGTAMLAYTIPSVLTGKNSIELLDERGQLEDEWNKIIKKAETENRNISDEENNAINKIRSDIQILSHKIYQTQLAEGIKAKEAGDRKFGKGSNNTSKGEFKFFYNDDNGNRQYIRSYTKDNINEITSGEKLEYGFSDVLELLRNGNRPKNETQQRALETLTPADGGILVPVKLMDTLIPFLAAKTSVIAAGAHILRPPKGSGELKWAKILSLPTPSWHVESENDISDSDMTFGSVSLKWKTMVVKSYISGELLTNGQNVETAFQEAASKAMAVELDRVALFGQTSSNEPEGIDQFSGKITIPGGASGHDISAEHYIQLIQAVREMRKLNHGLPTGFIMSPEVEYLYNSLVATDNQPLMKPKIIENIPTFVSTTVPSNLEYNSTDTYSKIMFGDFTKLMIAVRDGLTIHPIVDKLGSNYQFGFLVTQMVDIAPLYENAFGSIEYVATEVG